MTVPEIDVDQLATLGPIRVQLIDVREADEFHEARVPGARLIPLQTVPDSLDEMDRGETVYVVCASGGRSMRAAEFLAEHGFESVNIAGGTRAWVDAGHAFDTGSDDS